MTWKKSKDGGMDFDIAADKKYEEAKKRLFNPYGSAHTVTFNFNQEEVKFDDSLEARRKRLKYKVRRKHPLNG